MSSFEGLKHFFLGARQTLCDISQCFVDHFVFLVPPDRLLPAVTFRGTSLLLGTERRI
jgi:hypothetical protein